MIGISHFHINHYFHCDFFYHSLFKEFCYGVYNQCELFICLNLMVKNKEIHIESYFKLWIGTN
jgi:hypothetical protein